jgi:hypothetical protein
MSDRPRKSDGASPFPDESPPGLARHPASPSPTAPWEAEGTAEFAERPGSIDDEAKEFARTLRALIQSLPPRPDVPRRGAIGAETEAIAGVAAPTLEDQPTTGARATSEDNLRQDDTATFSPDRIGSFAAGSYEVDAALRSDLAEVNRREEVVTIPSVAPLRGDMDREPAADPLHDPIEGMTGEWGAQGTRPVALESSTAGVATVAVAAGVDARADLASWGSRRDRALAAPMIQGVGPAVGTSPEMVPVGPVGPVARLAEGLDRSSAVPAPASSWDGTTGGDPFGGHGAVSPGDEGPSGVDLSPTNALLGQILDELRRHNQSAPIASGRSVYPER